LACSFCAAGALLYEAFRTVPQSNRCFVRAFQLIVLPAQQSDPSFRDGHCNQLIAVIAEILLQFLQAHPVARIRCWSDISIGRAAIVAVFELLDSIYLLFGVVILQFVTALVIPHAFAPL